MFYRILFAVFVLFAAAPHTSAVASDARACNGSFCFQPQTRTGCLKPQIWGILRRLATRVGSLEITSGCNGKHARNSYHYKGMAVDFRAMHASQSTVMAALRSDAQVGGLIAEPRGLVHVDSGRRGPQKWVSWRTGGKRQAARMRIASRR